MHGQVRFECHLILTDASVFLALVPWRGCIDERFAINVAFWFEFVAETGLIPNISCPK